MSHNRQSPKKWHTLLRQAELKEQKDKEIDYAESKILSENALRKKLREAKRNYKMANQHYKWAKENKKVDKLIRQSLFESKQDLDFLTQQQLEIKNLQQAKLVSSREAKSISPIKLFDRATIESKRAFESVDVTFKTINAPIFIRNIVYGPDVKVGVPKGEFKWEGNDEHWPSVINRMFLQVKKMFETGKAVHLAENFYPTTSEDKASLEEKNIPTAPLLIRPDKVNDITRVSSVEFSFYPSKQYGPIPANIFNQLLNQIRELTTDAPENLHLLLGTFPVADIANNVSNVSVYVVCGPKPDLALTVKAIPSIRDPYYPGTQTAYFHTGSECMEMIRSIQSQGEALCWDLATQKSVSKKMLEQFTTLCTENKDYPPPIGLTLLLNDLKTEMESKSPNLFEQRDILLGLVFQLGIEEGVSAKIDAYYDRLLFSKDPRDQVLFCKHYGEFLNWTKEEVELLCEKLDKRQMNPEDDDVLQTARQQIKGIFENLEQFKNRLLKSQTLDDLLEFYEVFEIQLGNNIKSTAAHVAKQKETKSFDEMKEDIHALASLRLQYMQREEKAAKELALLKTSKKPSDIVKFLHQFSDELNWIDYTKNVKTLDEATALLAKHLPIPQEMIDTLSNIRDKNLNLYTFRGGFLGSLKHKREINLKATLDAISNHDLNHLDQPIPGVHARFARHIMWQTIGGAISDTSIDICRDHHSGIAKQSRKKQAAADIQKMTGFLSETSSHFVTSDSIWTDNIFSITGLMEQADPSSYPIEFKNNKRFPLKPSETKTQDNAFGIPGSTSLIEFYPPQPLRSFGSDIQHYIDMNNILWRDYAALTTLRDRYPKLASVYSDCILIHLLSTALHFISLHEKDYFAEKGVIEFTRRAKREISTLEKQQGASLPHLETLLYDLSVIQQTDYRRLHIIAMITQKLLITEINKRFPMYHEKSHSSKKHLDFKRG